MKMYFLVDERAVSSCLLLCFIYEKVWVEESYLSKYYVERQRQDSRPKCFDVYVLYVRFYGILVSNARKIVWALFFHQRRRFNACATSTHIFITLFLLDFFLDRDTVVWRRFVRVCIRLRWYWNLCVDLVFCCCSCFFFQRLLMYFFSFGTVYVYWLPHVSSHRRHRW